MTPRAMLTKWPEIVVADTDETPLPLPFIDYAGEPRNATAQSKASAPKILRRSRRFLTWQTIKATWFFTSVQYYAFQSLYQDALGCGTAQFRMNLRYPKNTELTEWVCRFAGEGYGASYLEGVWQVAANLELIGPYLLSDFASPADYAAYYVEPVDGDTDTEPDVPYQTSEGYDYHVIAPS